MTEETQNTANAAEFVAIGTGQIFQAEEALFIGAVSLAMGRIAAVQGWNDATKVKATEYDESALDGIAASRAKFYRIKAAMVKGSGRINKEYKNTLEKVRAETSEQAVATMVAALRADGIDGFMAFYTWAQNKGDGAQAEKPSLEDQIRAAFLGTEKNPDGKIGEFSTETLREIAAACSAETSRRMTEEEQRKAA